MATKLHAWCLICLIVTLVSPLCALAQDGEVDCADPAKAKIDSLLSLIKGDTPDSVKAKLYYDASLITSNVDERLRYCRMSIDLCDDADTLRKVNNATVMAYCYYVQDRRDLMLSILDKNIPLADQIRAYRTLQSLYKLKAMYFEKLNINDSIFSYYNMALEVGIRTKDTSVIAGCHMDLGLTYTTKKYFAEAEYNLKKAAELDSLSNNQLELAAAYYSLGELYSLNDDKDYLKAKQYLVKATEIFDRQNSAIIRYVICKYLTYNILADVYIKLAEKNNDMRYADSCRYYNKQALDYFMTEGYTEYYCYKSMTYVDYLVFCKKYKEALNFLLELEEKINPVYTDLLNTYYGQLRKVYYALGDYKNAYDVFEKNFKTSTMLRNDSTLNKIADAKAEQAILMEKLKLETAEQLHELETSRLRVFNVSLIIGLVLVSLLVFYILTALRIRQNSNKVLSEKNQEISAQKDIIVEQWRAVENANRKLLGSINYAKRIQYAAMSKEEDVKELFPDSFIYYSPRDIVSGDFYYVAKCGRYSVLITADCTGHGIPGAFLSMLGISAIKEYCVTDEDAAAPGVILDHLRDFIKATLVSETQQVIDDGMEMTICCYDFEKMELRFAAANQTAYLLRNGNVIKMRGDRMPVGHYLMEKDHFQTFVQPIEKGDVIYSCSDGIQDQIGGSDDSVSASKLLANRLLVFLLANYTKPMDVQCAALDTFINEWRGDRPQVDDMTLIGVRV